MNEAKLLHPDRVRELMAAMQPKGEPQEQRKPDRPKGKIALAYDMVRKTGCSLSSAAMSWGVKVKSIIRYAKENDLPYVITADMHDDKAKQIVESGQYLGEIPHGLKQRVGYYLALKMGMSKACRLLKIHRRGVYYYCERYNLPTPERSIKRQRQ